ncbi:MAG: cyclic nucleotide-binding domain-containing protein [Leptospiraceae bacterium]|nr:cyclic nucleotide-binding domain-containing protein [Leptospiraceae bacterium]
MSNSTVSTTMRHVITDELLHDSLSKDFRKGEMLISEGAPSNETMYFILSGVLSVYKKRGSTLEEINILNPGEFFGEIALVSDQPRTATVVVKSEKAKLILFNKENFIRQTKSNPMMMFTILKAMVARVYRAQQSLEKLFESTGRQYPEIIAKLNQTKIRLNNLKLMDFLQIQKMTQYRKNEKVFREEDQSNGLIYFVVRGDLRGFKKLDSKNILLASYEAGDFVGESSFFNSKPQYFTAMVTSEESELVWIDKVLFMEMVKIHPEIVLTILKSFIWKLINTEKASNAIRADAEKSKNEKETDIRNFLRGTPIIKEDDPSNETMYFILNGEMSVFKNRGSKRELVNVLHKGDFFGELSLISNQPRTATIEVRSESADLILFSKKKFIEQTKQNPSLMMSILKATVARLLRAETGLEKLIKKIPDLGTDLKISLEQSRTENINIFKYVHNVFSSLLAHDDKVYGEGDASNGVMFFLLSGQLGIYKTHNKRNYKITTLEPGDFFGEVSLVTNMPRYNMVKVISDKAKIASIDLNILLKIVTINPGFLLSLLRTVIWKLIIMEKAVTKLNIEYDMYEKKI